MADGTGTVRQEEAMTAPPTTSTLAAFIEARLGDEDGTARRVLRESGATKDGVTAAAYAVCALRRVEADRKILALHTPCHICTRDESGDDETAYDSRHGTPCPTLRALASQFAGHEGWREEWS